MSSIAIKVLVAAALLAVAGSAVAQTRAVATVDGTILDSDGSRILYIPTADPRQLRIQAADGTDTLIAPGQQYTPIYGYLSPTGAAFAAEVQGVISQALFNFNAGGLTRIGTLNARETLRVSGQYAVFSGLNAVTDLAIPSFVYRLDTTTGLVTQAPGDNGNTELDVTDGGLIAYWTANGWSANSKTADYNIETFDGAVVHRITNTNNSFNVYPRTDGDLFLFRRVDLCCVLYNQLQGSQLVLSDGVNETVLVNGRIVAPDEDYRMTPDQDYQIKGGWIAFRDFGTLYVRSPSGVLTNLGASSSILQISEFGELAYTLDNRTFLRTADGVVWEVGSYGSAFNVGHDWYFYRAGELVRFVDGLTVALDADFSATSGTFTARDGTTFYGVTNIAISRALLVEGATTVDTKGFEIGLNGSITGPGSLKIVGGGLLTLRGANSFAGGLEIGADGRLVGDTRSVNGAVIDNGELTLDQAFDGPFAGTLSGQGVLRKTGAGTLVLGGLQPFSGTTLLAAGGLQLADIDTPSAFVVSAGLLSGSGRIGGLNVQGGAVAPGPGMATIAIADGLTLGANSLYAVELASGASDRLVTGGVALLQGGSLDLRFAPERYSVGSRWRIVQGSTLNGTFGQVRSEGLSALLNSRLTYNSDSVDVVLTVDQERLVGLAGTKNQRATAGAVAALPDSSTVLNEIVWLPEPQIPAALDQLSGELHATTLTALFETDRFTRTTILRQVRDPRSGRRIWGTASTYSARYDGMDDLISSRVGSRDFAAGIDVDPTAGSRIGAAIGFGDQDVKSGSGRLSNAYVGATLYGQATRGAMVARGGVGLTWLDLDSDRRVAFGAINESLRSGSRGWSNDLFAEVAFPLDTGGVDVEPFVGVSRTMLRLDSFQETGGGAALASPDVRSSRSLAVAGLRAQAEGQMGSSRLFARGELSWEHELDAGADRRTLAFVANPGRTYQVQGLSAAGDAAHVGAGLGLHGRAWRVEVSYDGVIARSQQQHAGGATVNLSF